MTTCALILVLCASTVVVGARETNVIVNHITDRRTFCHEGTIRVPEVNQEDHAHPQDEPDNPLVIAIAVEEVPHSCPSRVVNFILGSVCTIAMILLAGHGHTAPPTDQPGA